MERDVDFESVSVPALTIGDLSPGQHKYRWQLYARGGHHTYKKMPWWRILKSKIRQFMFCKGNPDKIERKPLVYNRNLVAFRSD